MSEKVNKYQNSKIYKLVSRDCSHNLIYIGSTYTSLKNRLWMHRGGYKQWKKNKGHYVTSYDLFEKGEVDIIELEKYPCKDKAELHARERFYIESMNCVNKKMPTRTLEEFYNSDYRKQYIKDRNEKLKTDEKYQEWVKEYEAKRKLDPKRIEYLRKRNLDKYLCECGSTITRRNTKTHLKTKKHQNFIKQYLE